MFVHRIFTLNINICKMRCMMETSVQTDVNHVIIKSTKKSTCTQTCILKIHRQCICTIAPSKSIFDDPNFIYSLTGKKALWSVKNYSRSEPLICWNGQCRCVRTDSRIVNQLHNFNFLDLGWKSWWLPPRNSKREIKKIMVDVFLYV